MQVGDACAAQSPLSFGGFGSMLRHLRRLSVALDEVRNILNPTELSFLDPKTMRVAGGWLIFDN